MPSNPQTSGNFTIASGATATNVINGNGYGLAGFWTDATAMTGATITVMQAPDDASVPTTCAGEAQDMAGNKVNVVTLHADSKAGLGYCPLDTRYFHTVHFVQLVSASAEGAARTLIPVWVRYSD